MRVVSLIALFALMYICLCDDPIAASAQKMNTRENTQPEAERLWEQAVSAKGGRARLHAVENLLVSSRLKGKKNLFQSVELRYEHFYVFPSKGWHWNDEGESGLFTLSVEWFDLERNLKYLAYANDPTSPRKMQTYPRERDFLFKTQLLYLLESRWQKPRPLAARTERIGLKKFDVVETVVNRERVDFYLDRKTHLPAKVVEHYGGANEEQANVTFNLDDYEEVSGIQLPHTVTRVGPLGSLKQRVHYQLNVAYDEGLFQNPPTMTAGAEAWKPKR